MEWKNLSYAVNVKGKMQDLLREVNGYAKPGEMIALMGPSGAGKSTLLDVLAGKKNAGEITGEILVNGKPKDKFFTRNMGYVEQFDSHMDTFTVYEAIMFSAQLRLPATYSEEQRENIVLRCIDTLGLTALRNTYTKDITQEERKKTTIAVELVSEPGLLFLDEPTTGLDSGAALNVMETVQKLVRDQNLTVICTIHQPSANVYRLFDKMLLLKSNPGAVAYFGTCDELNAYYEREGFGVSDEDKNPADWAIEALKNQAEPGDIWKATKECEVVKQEVEEGICKEEVEQPYTTVYARGVVAQFTQLYSRALKMFYRNKIGLYARLGTAFILGILFGLLYVNFDGRDFVDDPSQQKFIRFWMSKSIVFLCVVYATESAAQEIPAIISERPMRYREIDSKLYNMPLYYIARFVAQFPWLVLQVLLFQTPLYFMGLVHLITVKHYFSFLFGYLLILSFATSLSQLFAIASPTDSVGNVLFTTWVTLSRMLAGFLTFVSVMKTSMVSEGLFVLPLFNALDFFKYALFFLASIDPSNWSKKNPANQKTVMEELKAEEIAPADADAVFYIGIFALMYVCIHVFSIITITFKRWDSR